MGIDDLGMKGNDPLHGEEGETASDAALDKGSDTASDAASGPQGEQVHKAATEADERVGQEYREP